MEQKINLTELFEKKYLRVVRVSLSSYKGAITGYLRIFDYRTNTILSLTEKNKKAYKEAILKNLLVRTKNELISQQDRERFDSQEELDQTYITIATILKQKYQDFYKTQKQSSFIVSFTKSQLEDAVKDVHEGTTLLKYFLSEDLCEALMDIALLEENQECTSINKYDIRENTVNGKTTTENFTIFTDETRFNTRLETKIYGYQK